MTALDELVQELAAAADRLPTRAKSALFAVLAHGLLGEFEHWARIRASSVTPFVNEAIRSAESFARTGEQGAGARALLDALEANTPDGEYVEGTDATAAQDCWICADVSVRVQLDPTFEVGSSIEYALEPVLQHTSNRLFGVSQVGSGEAETSEIEALLAQDSVASAVHYCRFAIETLKSTTDYGKVIDDLKHGAAHALVPG